MNPVIELDNLKKVYENEDVKTLALSGVSFSIKKGEFVAIMGPSGSGKSSLLHILGFLDRHTGGKYWFEGKTIDDYSPDELARLRNEKMGFIFQSFNLLRRATVMENVRLPLMYSNRKESEWNKIAMEAIKKVGLEHRTEHLSSQLSGGEQQRVAIARAISNNPSIIFADEPTGNLDSKSGGKIMECIDNLHEAGNTVILITHETYTAEYAERIIRLKDGAVESDSKVSSRRHSFVK